MKFAIGIIISFLLVRANYSQDFPSIESPLGKIKGHYRVSSNGNDYEAYEGIPYALPPTEDRRFLPPEPAKPWQGVLDASEPRALCIGLGRDGDVTGVEDCLYLDVYAPVKKTNNTLPVIVYIYGGGFQFSGLTHQEQEHLIDHDIIFVSFNHRHGSLGFLSTEDEVVPGNMGLKDQAMVLKWVSENIRYFGGDSKKITIAGASAGGASVHYHYLSPMSKGLFRSGLSFSGTAFDSWTQAKDSKNKAIQLGRLMNCTTVNTTEMINCLRTRPACDIVQMQAHFMPWHLNEFSPFGPVVEKNSKHPFIDRSPIDIINSGDVYDAPWVTGVVSEEGLYPVAEFATNRTAFEDIDRNWDTIAPHLLQYYYSIPKQDHAAVAKKIRKHYFGDQAITQRNIRTLIHLVGDRIFVTDAAKAARAQAKVNRNPVRFYYYSYRAASSFSDIMSHTTIDFGVSHGDDVLLVLGNPFINPKNATRDFAMQQHLMKLWLSVARDGVPNLGSKWAPIDANNTSLKYLHIIEPGNLKETTNSNLGEKHFWEIINFNENKPLELTLNENALTCT